VNHPSWAAKSEIEPVGGLERRRGATPLKDDLPRSAAWGYTTPVGRVRLV